MRIIHFIIYLNKISVDKLIEETAEDFKEMLEKACIFNIATINLCL